MAVGLYTRLVMAKVFGVAYEKVLGDSVTVVDLQDSFLVYTGDSLFLIKGSGTVSLDILGVATESLTIYPEMVYVKDDTLFVGFKGLVNYFEGMPPPCEYVAEYVYETERRKLGCVDYGDELTA